MSANYQSVRSQIDKLDNGDKVRLLSELFDLLVNGEQAERQRKWAAVAESRLTAYDDGEMAAEDWHSLREQFRQQLSRGGII